LQIKKTITLICLIVLCVQIIPLRQIGGLLFNNQITEEIAHSSDCGKKATDNKDSDQYLPAVIHHFSETATASGIHRTTTHSLLIKQHVAEVQTPPPNLA
jgi:hypothetical protein